jgi:outer membrane protein insertion porin family
MKRTGLPPGLFVGAAALAALLCLLPCRTALGAPAAPTAAAAPGAPIGRIYVQNNYLLTREQVLSGLGLSEGAPFDSARLQAAVQAWNGRGAYGTISYRIEPTPSGSVDVYLDVSERVKLTGVYFEGNQRLSSQRLQELLSLTPGQTVTSFQVHSLEQAIVDAYKQQGYPLASSRAVLGNHGTGDQDIIFYVAEGPRTYVRALTFSGNQHVPASELRAATISKVRHWPSFIWPGWFDEATFSQDAANVAAACRARGYLDANAAGSITYSPDMTSVTLNIIVHEGPRYYLKDVAFEGNTIYRDDELAARLPFVIGQPFHPADLEAATHTIADMYHQQGYMDVDPARGTVTAQPVFAPAGTDVTARIIIQEGQPVFIRRIEVRGLTKTKESVVRRNLTFYPGQRADSEKIKESEQLLANTGYFDQQKQPPVDITLEPDQGAVRDAIVNVQEGPTGRFMVGAGVGSDSGLLGELSLEEDNFDIFSWPSQLSDLWRGNALRGGGQKLSVILRAGTQRSYYSLSWLDPAFRNSAYSVGVNLYSAGIVRDYWDETRTGASVTGGEQLTKFINRTITVGYESISIDNVDKKRAEEIQEDKGSHSKPYVRFEVSTDRRDYKNMPTEGYSGDALIEFAAGDVQAVKLELSGDKYWTLYQENGQHRQVLGVRGRIGVITPYGSRVPVYERYYTGGFSSMRGFAFQGVSPADAVTGDRVGGEGLLTGTVEYSIPVTSDDRLRLLGFVDAGYVSAKAKDVLTDWSELRLAPGIGFRWQVPFLGLTTIEVDLAVPVLKQDGDKTQALSFSFGAARAF